MSNRLVVASRSAICPDDAPKRGWFPNMPPMYADLLRSNLAALDSFGVRLTDSRFLYRTAIAAWERRDRGRRAPLVAAIGTSVAGLVDGVAARAAAELPPPATPDTVVAAPRPGVVPCSLSLISQRVIQPLPDGVELRVPAGAIVTATWRDLAAARSIKISRECDMFLARFAGPSSRPARTSALSASPSSSNARDRRLHVGLPRWQSTPSAGWRHRHRDRAARHGSRR